MPTEHFKSKDAYRKWNAYTHMHGIKTHLKTAVIGGKTHEVKHGEAFGNSLRKRRKKKEK